MEKPLVIKVKKSSVPNGTVGKWEDLSGNIEPFIADIETPAIDKDTDISAQVSGIPTAYARANLFNSALISYGKAKESVDQNLNAFYGTLSSEWRGFIACIALDYSRLKTMRIYLQYSDGKDIAHTSNIYEPKGTFGTMLFHRKPLWCKNPLEEDELHKNTPFLYIVKYDDMVVGATSPECLLFTSCSYKIANSENRAWVDYKTGKFKDPLVNGNLDMTQTLQLYAYVNYLIEGLNNDGKTGINGLSKYYADYLEFSIIPKYDNIIANLTAWRKEIETHAAKKNFKLEAASVPPINLFDAPFDVAFNYKDEMYGCEGNLSGVQLDANAVSFNPKELLLPDTARIARLILKGPYKNEPEKLPVYLLKAVKKDDHGENAYFALPLSPKGIKVFGRNIGDLVAGENVQTNVPSRLTAIFDPNAEKNNLEVTLHLEMSDKRTKEMKATYTCGGIVKDKDIIVWPNFISKRWHRYFMYSELPHNVNQINDYPFQAVPFVGDELKNFDIINNEDGTPLYLGKDGHDVDFYYDDKQRHVETSIHIRANGATADNPYKYEIYECNHPFKGVRLGLPDGNESGFLLIKYTTLGSPLIPQNKLDIPDSGLYEVSLGVDFGSTNTSIAYFKADEKDPSGINFKNRRVSLLHAGEGGKDVVADEKQLFFFQSNEKLSNSIKSTLTLHDARRIHKEENEAQDITRHEKEVKGGFPCFSNNLPVGRVDKQFILLKTQRCGDVNQAYNMKWDTDDLHIAYKKAFLRSLMLHVYAELFDANLFPNKLKWSYPSSMNESMLLKYSEIWASLKDVNPLNDVNNHGAVTKDERFQLEISEYKPVESSGRRKQSDSLIENDDILGFGGLDSLLDDTPQPAQDDGFDTSLISDDILGSGSSIVEGKVHKLVLEKDDDTKHFAFNPVPLVNDLNFSSMTEACAVANSLNEKISRDDLLICFDIGGSTTDISALCYLGCNSTEFGRSGANTMIKQNSIHFAAQLVAFATGYCRNFDKVLLSTCEQFGYRIEGLNLGDSRYSKDTAAYYFEQMVDRLDTPEKLAFFYKKISTECSELFCVDVYVTGLILYYAGLLTRKLVKQVRNSDECRWREENGKKPDVRISFAGKGARIMEWLGTVNKGLADKYYQLMFVKGLGQSDAGQFITNRLRIDWQRPGDGKNVKFEVSMGLAKDSSTLMRPAKNDPIEVIGEEGFFIEDEHGNTVKLDADNSITADMMSCLGDRFYGNAAAGKRFREFLDVFVQVAQKYLGMKFNVAALREIMLDMGLTAYIKNTPEYRSALRAERFDFVSPILILEGLKFYEDYLLKNMGKS